MLIEYNLQAKIQVGFYIEYPSCLLHIIKQQLLPNNVFILF